MSQSEQFKTRVNEYIHDIQNSSIVVDKVKHAEELFEYCKHHQSLIDESLEIRYWMQDILRQLNQQFPEFAQDKGWKLYIKLFPENAKQNREPGDNTDEKRRIYEGLIEFLGPSVGDLYRIDLNELISLCRDLKNADEAIIRQLAMKLGLPAENTANKQDLCQLLLQEKFRKLGDEASYLQGKSVFIKWMKTVNPEEMYWTKGDEQKNEPNNLVAFLHHNYESKIEEDKFNNLPRLKKSQMDLLYKFDESREVHDKDLTHSVTGLRQGQNTPSVADSIEYYFRNGYKWLNYYLRHVSVKEFTANERSAFVNANQEIPSKEQMLELIQLHLYNLKSLNWTKTKLPATVTRGLENWPFDKKDLQPGRILVEKGFLATTYNPIVSGNFEGNNCKACYFIIHLPTGTSYLNLTRLQELAIRNHRSDAMKKANSEDEILLLPNSELQVLDVFGPVVELRLLNPH